MIDPFNLRPPIRGRRQQEWVIFAVCVAGRKATMVAAKVDAFLKLLRRWYGWADPFELLHRAAREYRVREALEEVRMGQYTRIARALYDLSIGLRSGDGRVTDVLLRGVRGVGFKTRRMILLYNNPKLRCAVLDTHVLKFLRLLGHDVPKSTPSNGSTYRRLEQIFLFEADRRGMTSLELDTAIWRAAADGRSLSALVRRRNVRTNKGKTANPTAA